MGVRSKGERKMSKALLCLWLACVGIALAAPETKNKPTTTASRPSQASSAARKPLSTGSSSSRRLLASVTSISPTYGPMEGNSLVMMTGDFSDVTAEATKECQFGTSKTTATKINATTVSCRTPKHSTGAATVKFFHGGTEVDPSATFTFFPTMFVSDFKTSSVLRYNADTGAFFDVFVQPRSGGLDGPWGLAFGLDHNFYVASERTSSVLVYDGSTGAFLKKFCTVKGQPRSMVFHYWDLYVASAYGDKIYRYNGYTGSPRGVYIEGGGLDHPWGLIFDKFTNDTYVTSEYKDHIFRYKQPTWGLYGGYGVASTNGGIHVTGAYDPATQA